MKKAIRVLFILAFTSLPLASCSSPAAEATPAHPTSALTNTPLPPTITPTPPQPTGTEVQLPVVNKPSAIELEYCKSPSVLLTIADARGLSEDEIAGKLMELWLAYYNAPQAPGYCRIDDYHIDEVSFRDLYLLYIPKGDFMRGVNFSIKLIQIPNFWMAWPGWINEQNWLHTGAVLAVFRSDSGYTWKFATP